MKHIALVCKLMPLYRLAVFHELSKENGRHKFTCFGDTKQQGGIGIIPWSMANKVNSGGINWIKTSNYFYIPERLLWQTGIVKRILSSEYKYFIFEGGVYHLPTWLFAILCRVSGKKVLFWTHGFKGFDKGLKKIIRTWYFKLAHGLLLYGNHAKEIMKEDGFNENRLFVIYNSLGTSDQYYKLNCFNSNLILELKSKIFNTPELFTVIFIGRLVKSKKIPFLLRAVKELSDQGRPINCIIIGDGPETNSIISFISVHHIEKYIRLTGALYIENEIFKYFEMADLMISPGNVGLNCLHSLAYGVPVLTHNNFQFQGPEVEAIKPGETGLLFEYNNYDDFLMKIDHWVNLKLSKEDYRMKCQEELRSRYNPVNHAASIINAIDSI